MEELSDDFINQILDEATRQLQNPRPLQQEHWYKDVHEKKSCNRSLNRLQRNWLSRSMPEHAMETSLSAEDELIHSHRIAILRRYSDSCNFPPPEKFSKGCTARFTRCQSLISFTRSAWGCVEFRAPQSLLVPKVSTLSGAKHSQDDRVDEVGILDFRDQNIWEDVTCISQNETVVLPLPVH